MHRALLRVALVLTPLALMPLVLGSVAAVAQDFVLVAPTPATRGAYDILFGEADIDRDGRLARSELIVPDEIFEPADEDRDGMIEPYEFYKSTRLVYGLLDVDGNGMLQFDEFDYMLRLIRRGTPLRRNDETG